MSGNRLASSSVKNPMYEYHRLAADALLGERPSNVGEALLTAAEAGQYEVVQRLLAQRRSAVNARCQMTGDTPIIAAARRGHSDIVGLLLKAGADVTLQNDSEENAVDVASLQLRKQILSSIIHEDRAMSNAQALLQSAWLGDSVTVKRYLSGSHYIDVDCRNSDGVTPLLLVTRDLSSFEKIQAAMETEYNPVAVIEELLNNQADINACDKDGRSALHFVSSSESVHARKMVSVLLRSGSDVDSADKDNFCPLHMASKCGHTAIIVALVEEGGANVNSKGGDDGDTPLMLSARCGHREAARYLIAKGADVTVVDENGDSALSVAKSPSMVRLIKEAWTEQTQAAKAVRSSAESSRSHTPLSHSRPCSDNEGSIGRDSPIVSPLSPERKSFFLTDRHLSRSLDFCDFEESDITDHETLNRDKSHHSSTPLIPLASEVEADDELEADHGSRRIKPATRRAHIRANFEESITRRKHPSERRSVFSSSLKRSSCDWKSRSLPRHVDKLDTFTAYSSADEEGHAQNVGGRLGGRSTRETARLRSREEKPRGRQRLSERGSDSGERSRPGRLALHTSIDEPADSHVIGGGAGGVAERRQERKSSFLPEVVQSVRTPPSPLVTTLQRHSTGSTPERLPSLRRMQPVAMVAVDTEREKLRVQQFGSNRGRRSKGKGLMQRSKSLMSIRGVASRESSTSPPDLSRDIGWRKRSSSGNSTVSLAGHPQSTSKVPLFPNVITPQLGLQVTGSKIQKSRSRLQPLSISSAALPHVAPPNPQLSVVNEDTESSSSDKTLTKSFSGMGQCGPGSEGSTLKGSSRSDFETDSLERHGVDISGMVSDSVAQTKRSQPSGLTHTTSNPHQQHPVTTSTVVTQHPLPPRQPQSTNQVINYAMRDGSNPLSPIWNQMQYFRTDSETSTNSEYITSYIGPQTPVPFVRPPDPANRKVGTDSGHGESTDEERGDGNSSSCSSSDVELASKESLKWKRGRILGKGAYGKVWEGLMDSAKMIAVKEVELDVDSLDRAQSQYDKIQVEVEILRSLRHKNIVSYLGTSIHLGTIYIFMEFISGGSLQSILRRFGPLDDRTVAHYTRQIVRALDYLHSNAIIHRDIKGANIMVTSRGVVKLIDFGCAKKYCQEVSGGMHSVRGTPYWMAPEVICGHGYGRKSDIWSLGCTVHEMATTKPPWADFPPEAAMFQIGIGKAIPPPPDHLSTKITNFFFSCLARDPANRPSARELLEDGFIAIASSRKESE